MPTVPTVSERRATADDILAQVDKCLTNDTVPSQIQQSMYATLVAGAKGEITTGRCMVLLCAALDLVAEHTDVEVELRKSCATCTATVSAKIAADRRARPDAYALSGNIAPVVEAVPESTDDRVTDKTMSTELINAADDETVLTIMRSLPYRTAMFAMADPYPGWALARWAASLARLLAAGKIRQTETRVDGFTLVEEGK